MAEQIECVGGPLDGKLARNVGRILKCSSNAKILEQLYDGAEDDMIAETIDHIYTYNPTTNTYQYKGVRK